jgi:AraC-like DNA-binding protein
MKETDPYLDITKQHYLAALPVADVFWAVDMKHLYQEINAHLFDEGYSASHALKKCGLGDHNATTQFKNCTGHTIEAYILHHRLALAQRLLCQTTIPISYIADALGFSSGISHFSMLFKKKIGSTPTTYRKNVNQEDI